MYWNNHIVCIFNFELKILLIKNNAYTKALNLLAENKVIKPYSN